MCYDIHTRICKYRRTFREFTNEYFHPNPLAEYFMLLFLFKFANICEINPGTLNVLQKLYETFGCSPVFSKFLCSRTANVFEK
jgi:hypothetical protein